MELSLQFLELSSNGNLWEAYLFDAIKVLQTTVWRKVMFSLLTINELLIFTYHNCQFLLLSSQKLHKIDLHNILFTFTNCMKIPKHLQLWTKAMGLSLKVQSLLMIHFSLDNYSYIQFFYLFIFLHFHIFILVQQF